MVNSKLVQILKTFSQDEWKEFERLVKSPYFNRGRNLVPFVKALRKFYPVFSDIKLTREYLYSLVYKDKKYNENTIKNVLYFLVEMAEEFLAQKRFSKNTFEKQLYLLEELSLRRIDGIFGSDVKKINATADFELDKKIKLKSIEINNSLLHARMNEYSFNIINLNDLKVIDFITNLLKSKIIFNTIYEQFNVAITENLPGMILNHLNIDSFMESLSKHDNKFRNEAALCYSIYKSETEPQDKTHFINARNIYYIIFESLSHNNKFNYFRFLEGYLIRHYRKIGNMKWSETQRLELSKKVISKNIYSFSENEYMPPVTYLNIFVLSLVTGDYGFSEELIKVHINKINPDFRANVKNLVSAYLSAEKKNFAEAMKFTSKIIFLEKDFWAGIYKFDLRNLRLILFYELGYYESFVNEADSFKHYLRNTAEASPERKKLYLDFVSRAEGLFRAKTSNRDTNIIGLKTTLKSNINTQYNFFTRWLMKKLNELERN